MSIFTSKKKERKDDAPTLDLQPSSVEALLLSPRSCTAELSPRLLPAHST